MNRLNLILTQTGAIFYDAYRELNSKRMFWIVLMLSGLVVGAIGAIGVNAHGITIFGMGTPFNSEGIDKGALYRQVFTVLGINIWLSWVAIALAIVSTASIFPDFLTGGAVDLFLCRPIGRLRLFLTKYASGLLFVTLQVLVFALASYLAIGLRGGGWDARIFVSIPLVVAIFSYLFCVSTLVGVISRSTMASVLLTILLWLMIFVVGLSDQDFMKEQLVNLRTIAQSDRTMRSLDAHLGTLEHAPTTNANRQLELFKTQRDLTMQKRREAQSELDRLARFQRMTYWFETALPKTGETNLVLNRVLQREEIDQIRDPMDFSQDNATPLPMLYGQDADIQQRLRAIVLYRSLTWVIGSSLLFELVVLAAAAWTFYRRDY